MNAVNNNQVVVFDRVTFAYNSRPILKDVSFEITAKEFLPVVGPNGGGKTTFLRLVMGLIQPQKGTITVLGREPGKARQDIGYVPQGFKFDYQFPVRVIDVVLMGRLKGNSFSHFSGDDRDAAAAALAEVNLTGMDKQPLRELSGGQKQRVLIARALVSNPKLLLLDEPTANVDTATVRELAVLLEEFKNRMTVIMVTHDYNFVSASVKTVMCIDRHVHFHPTEAVPSGLPVDYWGGEARLIRHDHKTPRNTKPEENND